MNAKDLNLSAHLDEILESGVISSLKIEGRTKSAYYAGITAKAYREGIDDFYNGVFEKEKIVDELNTTKNRGFTDGYLVSRPYERNDTQNLEQSISEGTHQVCAQVREDGATCMVKDKLELGFDYELVLSDENISEIDNEVGIVKKKMGNGTYVLKS